MTLLAIFGMGPSELVLLSILCCGLILPVVIVGIVIAFLAARRGGNDRRD